MLVYLALLGYTAIHEYISLSSMSMEITEEQNLIILMAHFYELLGVVNCWMQKF